MRKVNVIFLQLKSVTSDRMHESSVTSDSEDRHRTAVRRVESPALAATVSIRNMAQHRLTVLIVAVVVMWCSLCLTVLSDPVPTLPPAEQTLRVDDGSSVGILIKGTTGLVETVLKGVLGGALGAVG